MQKIKPCPFCRADSDEAGVEQWYGYYHVVCDCGAHGPRSETQLGAITLWNVRCRENESVVEG